MKSKHWIISITIGLLLSIPFIKVIEYLKDYEPEKPECINHPSYVWTCNDGKGNVAYCVEWRDLVNNKWITKYDYQIGNPNGYKDVTEEQARHWCKNNAVESCNL